MNRLLKSAVLGLAVTATTFSALASAEAGDRWRRGGYYGHHRNNGGDLVAAGVLGLAVGALAAGVATAPREPIYYDDYAPPPRRVYRAAPPRYYVDEPRVAYGLEPWSPQWYDYCSDRYRSFNPRTGTFTGYDGVTRFCEAN